MRSNQGKTSVAIFLPRRVVKQLREVVAKLNIDTARSGAPTITLSQLLNKAIGRELEWILKLDFAQFKEAQEL